MLSCHDIFVRLVSLVGLNWWLLFERTIFSYLDAHRFKFLRLHNHLLKKYKLSRLSVQPLLFNQLHQLHSIVALQKLQHLETFRPRLNVSQIFLLLSYRVSYYLRLFYPLPIILFANMRNADAQASEQSNLMAVQQLNCSL